MAKFKVGDRVRIRQWADMEMEFGLDSDGDIKCPHTFVKGMAHLCGRVATVTSVFEAYRVGLKFDDESGRIAWTYTFDMIEPINAKQKTSAETIVVYRNGDTVTALDKRDGRKATAKCSPDDTFDFSVGARLAFDRLMGKTMPKTEQKPKWYTGKVVCVESVGSGVTVGKVYNIRNGKYIDDDGDERPKGFRIKDMNYCSLYKFVAYKGGAE